MSQVLGDAHSLSEMDDPTDSDEDDNSSFSSPPSRETSVDDTTCSSDSCSDIIIDQIAASETRLDTGDEHNNFDENQQNEEKWSQLPSLSIEKIYSFLSRTDQCRMSLVCRRWEKDYSSPSLWKTVKFYLPEHDYSSEIYPEVRFARKYGSMFRHVEIICKRVRGNLLGVIWKQLKFFLQALTAESQLVSIKLINMGHYFRYLDDFIHEDVFRAIVVFFRSQKNLRVIDILDSNFTREEAVELLKVLSETCCDTLRAISLRGYVNDSTTTESSNESSADLHDIFSRLLSIQTIETDYSRLFEDMMRLGQEDSGFVNVVDQKRCLSTLNIYCEGTRQSDFRGIPSSAWKALNKVCPNFKVNLDLTLSIHARNEVERFIVRFMPIKTLELRFDKPYSSPRAGINVLFNHLLACRANDHLEVVNILWLPPISDLASAVITFLQFCPKLQTFHFHTRHTDHGIEDILKSLLERRPSSLKSVTLWFSNVRNEEDEGNLAALSQTYYPLLQVIGIEMFLLADPGRGLRRRNGTA